MIPIEKTGAITAPGSPDPGRRQERLELLVDLAEDLVDPLFDAGFGLVVLVGVVKGQPDAR